MTRWRLLQVIAELVVVAVVTLAFVTAVFAEEVPVFPGDLLTDQMRADGIEALKLAYLMNGNSMVRMGSLDLTSPFMDGTPRIVYPGMLESPAQEPLPKKDKRR